jgi:hypothetical protein
VSNDDFNAIAWADFVRWAWEQPAIRAAFTDATGIRTVGSRSAIEKLIDEATGAATSEAAAFVEWVTRTQWGLDLAPKAYRDTLEQPP